MFYRARSDALVLVNIGGRLEGLDVKIILFVELDVKAVKCRKADVAGRSLVYYLIQLLNN